MTVFNKAMVVDATRVLRAIDNPFRQRILDLVAQEELRPRDIQERMKRYKQQFVNSGIQVLLREELLIGRKEGRAVYYRLNAEKCARIRKGVEVIAGIERPL